MSVGEGVLIPSPKTDRQDRHFQKYYALRVTLPHSESGALQECISKYSKNYVMALHYPDDEVIHEHFHLALVDITTTKQVEAMKVYLKRRFTKAGNGFIAGKFRDNHVLKAIQYMKHDENVTFKHRGSHWAGLIDEAPDWDPDFKAKKCSEKKEIKSDPMLSFSNLLFRALKHRRDNNIESTDLGVTLEHMGRTTNWIPSPQMMKNGLDPYHYKIFEFRARGRTGQYPPWYRIRSD